MKKIICIVLVIFMTVSCLSFAAPNDWTYEPTGNVITIKGSVPGAAAGVPVVLLVLKPGKTLDELAQATQNFLDIIEYVDDTLTDENGTFSFVFQLPGEAETAFYYIRVGSSGFVQAQEETVRYVSAAGLEKIIENLKNAVSPEEIETILEQDENRDGYTDGDDLALNMADYRGLSPEAKGRVNNYIFKKRMELDSANVINSSKLLNDWFVYCAKIEKVNHAQDKAELEKALKENENVFHIDFTQYAQLNSKLKDNVFSSFTARRPYAESDEIKRVFDETVCITRINTVHNTEELEAVMECYEELLQLDYSGVDRDKLYTVILKHRRYDSLETLKDKYPSLKKEAMASTPQKPGNLGGGFGGGSIGAVMTPRPTAVPTVTPKPADKEYFCDMDTAPWAEKYVNGLAEKGIVSGDENGRFHPNQPIKREEFIKILISSLDIQGGKYEQQFADVEPGSWYDDYIRTACQKGIVYGKEDRYFGVGENITRQEMAVLIDRAVRVIGKEIPQTVEKQSFIDENEIAGYAKSAVELLQKGELVSGYEDGSFQPENFATRAECARVISDLLVRIAGKS